jgi:hypothetical protein
MMATVAVAEVTTAEAAAMTMMIIAAAAAVEKDVGNLSTNLQSHELMDERSSISFLVSSRSAQWLASHSWGGSSTEGWLIALSLSNPSFLTLSHGQG